MSLLPTAMLISARSLSNDDIISVTLFFWWLVISFNFCSSESMDAKELWWRGTQQVRPVYKWTTSTSSTTKEKMGKAPISRWVLHWEPQTLLLCPQLPGSSGRSWQPAPPEPAAPPSPPPWKPRSRPAVGSARFAGRRDRCARKIKATGEDEVNS